MSPLWNLGISFLPTTLLDTAIANSKEREKEKEKQKLKEKCRIEVEKCEKSLSTQMVDSQGQWVICSLFPSSFS